MDAIVQFVRNAFCCVKDLNLWPDTVLYDESLIPVSLPEPINKTTPLEWMIGITQFYAFASISVSGFRLIFQSGLGKRRRIEKLLAKRPTATDSSSSFAEQLIDESLHNEKKEAEKSIFIGVNILFIGIAFFWLFANSFHVTETMWIGGLPGLIHALSVMEVCLLPLLYYMLSDGVDLLGRAARMEYLVSILRKCQSKIPLEILNKETYKLMRTKGWEPFWTSGIFTNEIEDDVKEQKAFEEEVKSLTVTMNAMAKVSDGDRKMKATIRATADRMESDAVEVRYQGYREFVYFLLNFIAFYGYMLGIIAYYFDDSDIEAVPTAIRAIKLGMTNADADWHGNFAGDLMWTVEPVVILASPTFFRWIKPTSKKLKKD